MNSRSESFSAYESVPDALLVVGPDGGIVFANQHAARLFGYEPGEFVGIAIEALIPERFRPQHVEARAKFSLHPSVRPMGRGRELFARQKDGEEFPVEIGIGPADEPNCVVAVVRDISAVQSMRAELGQSRAQIETIFGSLESSIALLNSEGEILSVNAAWNAFARENGRGSNPSLREGGNYIRACRYAASIEPDAQRALDGIRSVLDGSQQTFNMEYPCNSPSQRRWFLMTVNSVRTDQGGVVVTHGNITERVLARQELERKVLDIERSREELRAETQMLRADIVREGLPAQIIGNSVAMAETLKKVEHAAKTDVTVLLFGETGTGKELLARALHSQSRRCDMPLIKVDCASLSPGLIESELFGHEKGAFTGAHESKPGRFERADRGTLFLDEVGELPLDLQAKLLRVLQEGEFHRLGSQRELKVDTRVVAATNRDLRQEVSEGRFRSDLYYRLSVFPIESPPLRDRREDIRLLASYFLSRFQNTVGKRINSIEKTSLEALEAYNWPGNIRELQNVIERSAILCSGDTLVVEEVLGDVGRLDRKAQSSLPQDLEGIERANILRALEDSGWKVKGEGNAASRLGINPSTLRSRMKKLGIVRR